MTGTYLWLGLCLVLASHMAPLHAWWFSNKITATTPSPAMTTAASTTKDGTKNDQLTDVGSEILHVASGIKQLVQSWDQQPGGELGKTGKQEKGNDSSRVEEKPMFRSDAAGLEGLGSSGVNVRALAELDSGFTNTSGIGVLSGPRDIRVPAWMTAGDVSPVCLPRSSDWGFCLSGSGRSSTFAVPNFLNHSTAEEVGATLADWAVFLSSRCHRDVERFFCLLLAPACPGSSPSAPPPPPPLLPCRSLCEILTDACWAALGGRDLPVTCHSLPEGLPHQHPCQPVSSCRCAGNTAG